MVRRAGPPASKVVLSDEEVAKAVREASAGQSSKAIDAAVSREMLERADVRRMNQNAYDRSPPSRPYAPIED